MSLPTPADDRRGASPLRKGQPGRVIAIVDNAQRWLCRRLRKLAAEHKPPNKIAVAIARELVDHLWAALQPDLTLVVDDPAEERREPM